MSSIINISSEQSNYDKRVKTKLSLCNDTFLDKTGLVHKEEINVHCNYGCDISVAAMMEFNLRNSDDGCNLLPSLSQSLEQK